MAIERLKAGPWEGCDPSRMTTAGRLTHSFGDVFSEFHRLLNRLPHHGDNAHVLGGRGLFDLLPAGRLDHGFQAWVAGGGQEPTHSRLERKPGSLLFVRIFSPAFFVVNRRQKACRSTVPRKNPQNTHIHTHHKTLIYLCRIHSRAPSLLPTPPTPHLPAP